jgi:hypothetical protein
MFSFIQAANKHFVCKKVMAADRANPVLAPFSFEAENAAPDVHEAVFASVKGRKSHGFYQFTLFQ